VDGAIGDDQSPEAIAGRLKYQERCLPYVSKNTIIRYLKGPHGTLIGRKWKKKPRRSRVGKSKKLNERVFIDKRPRIIEKRKRVGDMEADFVVSGKSGKGVLLTVVCRRLRVVFLELIPDVSIDAVHAAFERVQERFPEMKTITLDNDILFRMHKTLSRLLSVKIYFCHPYHSWEKGSIENANRVIRKYIPKGLTRAGRKNCNGQLYIKLNFCQVLHEYHTMPNHDIFSVPIDTISREEVEGRVGDILAGDAFRRIATVNPEFLVRARRDEKFRVNLLSADMRIPDGFGIVLDGSLSGKRIQRYPGADLLEFILSEIDTGRTDRENDSAVPNPPSPSFRTKEGIQESTSTSERTCSPLDPRKTESEKVQGVRKRSPANAGGWDQKTPDVFLLIRSDGLSSFEEILAEIRKRYPNLSVEGTELDAGVDSIPDKARSATIVFCNFGAPEQEYALESLRKDSGDIRIAMGVGGAFDYMTGKRKRAPKWMRAIGLEWLFRLAVQPGRIGRIWTAVVVFPFLCLSDRMRSGNREQ